MGSRFFTVQNGSQVAAAEFRLKAETTGRGNSAFRRNPASDESVLASRGYGELPVRIGPDAAGERRLLVAPGERIELRLPRGYEHAYQLVNGERRALPIGASWDPAAQTLAWQPAAGFLGEFQLVMLRGGKQLRILITVQPDR